MTARDKYGTHADHAGCLTVTAQKEFHQAILKSTNWHVKDVGVPLELRDPSDSARRMEVSLADLSPGVGPPDYSGTTAVVEIDPDNSIIGGGYCSIHFGKLGSPCKHVIAAMTFKGWPVFKPEFFHRRWLVKTEYDWASQYHRVQRDDSVELCGIDVQALRAVEATEDEGGGGVERLDEGSTSFVHGDNSDDSHHPQPADPVLSGASVPSTGMNSTRPGGRIVGGVPDPGQHTGRYSNVLAHSKRVAEFAGTSAH